mgnify:CR=1 FL=1
MASAAIERSGSRGGTGPAAALATAGGAVLLLLALGAALFLLIELVARFGRGGALLDPELSQTVVRYFGLGFAGASLLALPAALAAPFARSGYPPMRSRSALALVPGALAAVIIGLIAAAIVVAAAPGAAAGLQIAYRGLISAYSDYTFLFLPLAIVLAAALAGPGTPESAAAAAAPVVLVALAGVTAELSIAGLALAALLPLLIAALALAILYAVAPPAAVTPWLAGIALALGMTALVASGLFTPSEAMAPLTLFGLLIALAIRSIALRQSLGAMLRHAALETVSIVAVLAAALMVGIALQLSGAGRDPGFAVSPALLAACGAAYLLASLLLTPALVLCIALPFAAGPLRASGIDPLLAGAVLVLLSLAAIAARAGRRLPAAGGLTPAAALLAATVFAGLAVLAAFVPAIALAPVRAVLP